MQTNVQRPISNVHTKDKSDMTNNQKNLLGDIRKQINSARRDLDNLMYCSEPLADEDFEKVRQGYELLCQAADKLD